MNVFGGLALGIDERTYCLDWDTVTFTDPPGLLTLMSAAGINLSDYPLLLTPTNPNDVAGTLGMLSGLPQANTCSVDPIAPTTDLTANGPGVWAPPSFEVGPTQMNISIGAGALPLQETTLTGDFSPDDSQMVDVSINGWLPDTVFSGVCLLLPCVSCPNSSGSCLFIAGNSGIATDNGEGPLLP